MFKSVLAAGVVPAGTMALAAPTYQSNRVASQHEAARLLALAQIPAGAVRARPGVASTSAYELMGRPAVDLVERSEVWTVPEPSSTLTAWVQAHTPRGLTFFSSTTGTAGAGYTYSAPAGPAWALAELGESIVPEGTDRSLLSVGAMVAPLDPRPWPDNATGPRVRVTVQGGCPSTDLGLAGVLNPGPGLSASLLPPSAPTAALVCLYRGSAGAAQVGPGPGGAKPGTLAHHVALGATGAGALSADVRALPLSHVDGALTGCPLDSGAYGIVAFSYRSAPDVDLWVVLTGCGGVANGHIRTASGDLAQVLEGYAR